MPRVRPAIGGDGSDLWRNEWALGRMKAGYRLWRHTYDGTPDRWHLQLLLTYDRKAAQ